MGRRRALTVPACLLYCSAPLPPSPREVARAKRETEGVRLLKYPCSLSRFAPAPSKREPRAGAFFDGASDHHRTRRLAVPHAPVGNHRRCMQHFSLHGGQGVGLQRKDHTDLINTQQAGRCRHRPLRSIFFWRMPTYLPAAKNSPACPSGPYRAHAGPPAYFIPSPVRRSHGNRSICGACPPRPAAPA